MKLELRNARMDDLRELLRLLADDRLGKQREWVTDTVPEAYLRAFTAIQQDANNELVIAEHAGAVLGMLQLTFIPYLSYQGAWRALIESVRVHSAFRGRGVGHKMLEWAIERARGRNCLIVQLTSDKRRDDAFRFYESLGFVATHEGFKLRLD